MYSEFFNHCLFGRQVHITQGDYDGKAVIISWVTALEPTRSEVFYGKQEKRYDRKAKGRMTNYTFYNYRSGYIHHCLVDGLEVIYLFFPVVSLKVCIVFLCNFIFFTAVIIVTAKHCGSNCNIFLTCFM